MLLLKGPHDFPEPAFCTAPCVWGLVLLMVVGGRSVAGGSDDSWSRQVVVGRYMVYIVGYGASRCGGGMVAEMGV